MNVPNISHAGGDGSEDTPYTYLCRHDVTPKDTHVLVLGQRLLRRDYYVKDLDMGRLSCIT